MDEYPGDAAQKENVKINRVSVPGLVQTERKGNSNESKNDSVLWYIGSNDGSSGNDSYHTGCKFHLYLPDLSGRTAGERKEPAEVLMFAKLSDTIARSFVAHGTISEDRFAVCRYGIGQTFSILLNLVTTLCIGIAFGMIGESLLFLAAYIPLRSYAGGFHAATPMRCYWYSVGMQAAVLAILRFASVTLGVSVLIYTISGILLWCLAPTADRNETLDELEKKVYRRRTRIVWCAESILMIVLFFLQLERAGNSILLSMAALSVLLAVGKGKEKICCKKEK